MPIETDAENVEGEGGVVVEPVTVTGAVVEGTSEGTDTGIVIEAAGIDQAEDDNSEVRHRENGWRETNRGVIDIRQIEYVESSRKRGWGEIDEEEWDWEREIEEWDNERSRVEEAVEVRRVGRRGRTGGPYPAMT